MLSTFSARRVPNDALKYVLAAQLICLAPLFLILPKWLPALWIFACVWRYQIIRDKWTLPHWSIKGALAVACMAGLYLTYGFDASIEPLIGFLLAAAILKIIEAQKNSDAVIVLFVCFVLVATQLLFSQTVWALLYSVVSIIAIFMALNALFKCHMSGLGRHIKRNVVMVLQIAPIACLLFIVLPRLPPLWSMPSTTSAQTGFSDTMSPGDISELSKSAKVAFRVTFYDATRSNVLDAATINSILPPAQRYWRGLVFDEFKNNTWSRSDFADVLSVLNDQKKASNPQNGALKNQNAALQSLDYDVLIEPHNQRWLFSLYKASHVRGSIRTKIVSAGLVKAFRPVSARMQYRVTSHLDYRDEHALSLQEKALYTALPAGNPKARDLATKLGGQNAKTNTRRYIEAVLAYFQQSFIYTLNPPRLGVNSIDDFLFVSKRGFCEHFSSSFVYLMRSMGIPARIVVGYLGGEINPVDNYMVVKQSDAHAWAEVWVDDQGWVRVDPTSAVAPQRIEQSLSNALTVDEQRELQQGILRWGPLKRFANRLDAASYMWHRYVISYDNTHKKKFFSRFLGGEAPWRIAAFVCLSMAIVIFIFFMLPVLIKRQRTPAYLKLVYNFEKKCRVFNVARLYSQSPSAYAQFLGQQYGEYQKELTQIGELFEQVLYAPSNKNALADLRIAIKRFKPKVKTQKS